MNTHIIKETCPWPQRRLLPCRIADRPEGEAGQLYPWAGIGSHEVVIWIDDDPLTCPRHPMHEWHKDESWCNHERGWTCVIALRDLAPIGEK